MLYKTNDIDLWVNNNLSDNSARLFFTINDYTVEAKRSLYPFIAILQQGNYYHIVKGNHLDHAIQLFNEDSSHDMCIQSDYKIILCDDIS